MKHTKNYLIILLVAFLTFSCGPKKSEDIIIYELRKPIDFYNASVIVLNEVTSTIGNTKSRNELTEEQDRKLEKSFEILHKIDQQYSKMNFKQTDIEYLGDRRNKAIMRFNKIKAFLLN